MINLDETTIYVFVRGDLPEEQQLVQAAHAVFDVGRLTPLILMGKTGIPRIVVLDGGQSEKAFNKTLRKFNEGILPEHHFVFYSDPDMPELRTTAIATIPLTREQSLPLANYRLRRYTPVAQEREHQPTKLEDGCSSQPGRSTNCS
jgi:hypothetical protein